MIELSVVVPVYNEGANIEETIHALRQHVPGSHEVLIVYDFDEDTTVPVIRRLQTQFDNLRLIKNSVKRGPSGAIRSGIAEASAPRVLVAMADRCDDFTQIPLLMELLPASADIVCPSRYCPGGNQQLKASVKKFAPQFAGFLLKTFVGLNTYDPTNSYKMYSAAMLRQMTLTSTVSFSVTLEIVAKAHCLGYRIVEVPTTWLDRTFGKSNFKLGRSLVVYLPWFLLSLLRNRFVRVPLPLLRWWLAPPREATVMPREQTELVDP